MVRRLSLEVFEQDGAGADTVVLDKSALEEAKLDAYETGYTAGWEDAVSAMETDREQVKSELARNLQSLSFTYHEARNHVLRAVEPLISDLVAKVLPVLARETLAAHVLETVLPMAGKALDTPVSVVLNPSARPAVEALLEDSSGLPISYTEEPSLGEGQVYLRLGDVEQHIDLDTLVADVIAATGKFYQGNEEERRHG